MKNRNKFEKRWNQIAEKNIDFFSAYKEFMNSIKFEADLLKNSNNAAYKDLVLEAIDYAHEREIANNNYKQALKDETRITESFRNAMGLETKKKNSAKTAECETTIEEAFKKELQKQSGNYNAFEKEDSVTAEFRKQIMG